MAKAAGPKKSLFAAGVFDGLAAAATGTPSASSRILLADIDEDPAQPRTSFDQGELEKLAETIKLAGGQVLQPIGVRAPVDGRYMLVFGARRLRASRLLGLADIPYVIVEGEQATLAAQVIENQSRVNLSNSDLASVVERLGAGGMKGKQIAVICGLTEHTVTMFRSASRLPAFLSARMNDGDMRAIYELFTAWQKYPAEIEGAMEGHDAVLSVTEARRIIEDATGRATSSIYLKGKAGPAPELVTASPVIAPALHEDEDDEATGPGLPGILDEPEPKPQATPETPQSRPQTPLASPVSVPAPLPVASPPVSTVSPTSPVRVTKSGTAPVFIVEVDGERGELMTDRRSDKPGFAFVRIGTATIEAPFIELQNVNVE